MCVIDLNADVGEWQGEVAQSPDAELMPVITSANIACGYHAGDEAVMAATVQLAVAHHVAIGAHPGFDDRDHFGRREITLPLPAVTRLVRSQVQALARIASAAGARIRHVKPHGALYNIAARDPGVASAVADAVAHAGPELVLVGLAGSQLIEAGRRAGLRTMSEVFADRAYRPDGSLVPRGTPGAVIEDVDRVAERAVRMALDQAVFAIDGSRVPVTAETICIHGDTPGAAVLARRVRNALNAAGVRVSAAR